MTVPVQVFQDVAHVVIAQINLRVLPSFRAEKRQDAVAHRHRDEKRVCSAIDGRQGS